LRPDKERLTQLIARFTSLEIVVVGDAIVDSYLDCRAAGIANEAPVPLLEFVDETNTPGGAANVAANLAQLGVKTRLVGTIGEDPEAELLKQLLNQKRVEFYPLVVRRPTPRKTRVSAGDHYYLRLDQEESTALDEAEATLLKELVEKAIPDTQALLVSDYGKGTISSSSAKQINLLAQRAALPLFADLKPQNVLLFPRLSLITPNIAEARDLWARLNSASCLPPDPSELARDLSRRLSCDVVLKMSADGLLAAGSSEECTRFEALCSRPANVSGAGDTVIATLAAALTGRAALNEAAFLANLAASIAVSRQTTHAVTSEELLRAAEENSERYMFD
jgi:D-beta-D-heptose 7-phosphate kinase/D-beta-D-heptose 1-phosphate adenosyltransferase